MLFYKPGLHFLFYYWICFLYTEPEEAPGNLRCQATSQTQIEVRFRQIPIGKWNGVPNGYNVFYKSLLQLEDKESFLVENFNSTSTNAHSTTDSSTEYTVTISELEIFTNYSLVVGAYNNEGVGKLARVYCRTHEGGNYFMFLVT